ncbi:lytic murein transglycosylase [Bdellovibrio sp. qaytius]|nr:lytic murein transglycosylase [Bdellovibrio sp. qaytius]
MRYLFLIIACFYTLNAQALVTPWSSSIPKNSKFKANEDMRGRVEFWKKIYSEVSENAGLFHDPDFPEFTFGEVNWEYIQNDKSLTASEKRKKIDALINYERIRIAAKHKIKDPRRLRLQTGLKERMQKALFLSGQYLPMMEEVFRKKGLPIELSRLPFVESSFNVYAQSKVGASGLWQIMPFVARPEGYIKSYYDKRNHPYYATLLAANMLEDNYRALKKWPLAISAYNHGLGGIKKMVRVSQSSYLPDLIGSEDRTKSWGFASENFYACFLAVLEVEKEAKSLFGDDLLKAKPLPMNRVVTAKAVSKKEALKYFDGSLAMLQKYNPHLNMSLLRKNKMIPSGVPLILPKKASTKLFRTASL